MPSVEILGTLSSVIVAVSLTQKNIKLLRILNLIGASGFAVYGWFISSVPVLGLNSFIAVIDLYYYWTMIKYQSYFDHLEIEDTQKSVYLKKFLDFYSDDIRKFQPSFCTDIIKGSSGFFILRDMQPVSVLLFKNTGEDSMEMILDYAIPQYRDFKCGEFFFSKAVKSGTDSSIREIISYSETAKHSEYLKRLGFLQKQTDKEKTLFKLPLK